MKSKKRVFITGATGFVGKALCQHFLHNDLYLIKVAVRKAGILPDHIPYVVQSFSEQTDWLTNLRDVDVVIHLAGRSHVMHETEENPYDAYAAVNIEMTKALVEAAAQAGVKRFIYMSTTKVNGEFTTDKPFTEEDQPNPFDDYAKTKTIAERLIKNVCASANMDYVIIRPPLIYGPNVKANFKSLIAFSLKKWPLPLGAVNNKRSLVYLDNLNDFVQLCVDHPNARNEIFFVADDEVLSTKELIQAISATENKSSWLIAIPIPILKSLFMLINRSLFTKLCANFQVDTTKAKRLLGWKPPFSVYEGLKRSMINR